MKLKRVTTIGDALYGWSHLCPGCGHAHVIPTSGDKAWGFNGYTERPTFTPSVLHTWDDGIRGEHNFTPKLCHYFITDGNIVFCGDCTHSLSGKTVPLPEIPE